MRRDHGINRDISSNRPIDETIHRGFVDVGRQNPDMALSTWSQGTRYPNPADKT